MWEFTVWRPLCVAGLTNQRMTSYFPYSAWNFPATWLTEIYHENNNSDDAEIGFSLSWFRYRLARGLEGSMLWNYIGVMAIHLLFDHYVIFALDFFWSGDIYASIGIVPLGRTFKYLQRRNIIS